jgi:hypothetical protein
MAGVVMFIAMIKKHGGKDYADLVFLMYFTLIWFNRHMAQSA